MYTSHIVLYLDDGFIGQMMVYTLDTQECVGVTSKIDKYEKPFMTW